MGIAALLMALAGCQYLAPVGGTEPADYELAIVLQPPPAAIRKAQRQLAALGYDAGPADGVLGKRTMIAIKHFQVDQELDIDGNLTHELIDRLDKAPRRRAAGQTRIGRAAGGSGSNGKNLEVASPFYEVGDSYVYSDGRVETVSRVGPERTLWEATDGAIYTAYRNFILPPISWESDSSRIENQIRPAAGQKWPPATTEQVAFWVGSRAGDGSAEAPPAWSGKWRCAANDIIRLDVTVGRFEAVVIECDRANPKPGTWKKRTWYFVPDVGHYVRRTDLIQGTGHKVSVDLIAIRPGGKGWPPAARGGLDWAVQGALDAGNTENTVEWRSSAVGAMFNIHLKGYAPVTGRADCRRYDIERISPDQVRHFPAIACKMPWQARWMTPGLDPDAASPQSLKQPQ